MLNGPVLPCVETEAVDERLRLLDADLEVVEGGVVVDVRRADDQAVIGNDLDPRVGGLLQGVRQRRAVDRRDHQDLLLLGDHVLDLGELVRNVVVGVLQVGVVALGLQHLDHVVAVGDPPRGRLGRHRDADRRLVRPPAPAAATAKNAERERRRQFHQLHAFLLGQLLASSCPPAGRRTSCVGDAGARIPTPPGASASARPRRR